MLPYQTRSFIPGEICVIEHPLFYKTLEAKIILDIVLVNTKKFNMSSVLRQALSNIIDVLKDEIERIDFAGSDSSLAGVSAVESKICEDEPNTSLNLSAEAARGAHARLVESVDFKRVTVLSILSAIREKQDLVRRTNDEIGVLRDDLGTAEFDLRELQAALRRLP
jgi:hypothetical protein